MFAFHFSLWYKVGWKYVQGVEVVLFCRALCCVAVAIALQLTTCSCFIASFMQSFICVIGMLDMLLSYS